MGLVRPVVLVNLEMPDKLRIVILPSTRLRAYLKIEFPRTTIVSIDDLIQLLAEEMGEMAKLIFARTISRGAG